MGLFFSKLGFIHRRLWDRDDFYRLALFFGPAPLIGAGLAAIVWVCIGTERTATHQPPPWAHYTEPSKRDRGSPDAPKPAIPAKPLPALRADGSAIGYDPGWSVTANPVTLNRPVDANVGATPIDGFTLAEPTVTMARLLEGRPKNKLFAGVASGFLVIRQAGTYGISARLERTPGPLADCLVRFGMNRESLVRNLRLNMVQRVTVDYEPAWFALQPGLYSVGWAFGCWHGNEMSDLGQFSLMITEPGRHDARPLEAGDIVQ
jgi:hypothetical protein